MFTKSGAEQQLLQRAVDLKRSLVAALQKHRELQIDYKTRARRVVSVPLLFTVTSVLMSVGWLIYATRLDCQSAVVVEQTFKNKKVLRVFLQLKILHATLFFFVMAQ